MNGVDFNTKRDGILLNSIAFSMFKLGSVKKLMPVLKLQS